MYGGIFDNFMDIYRVYFSAAVKRGDLCLSKQMEVRTLSMLSVSLVFTHVVFALRLGSALGFRDFLVELDFRHGTMERVFRSQIVTFHRRLSYFAVLRS